MNIITTEQYFNLPKSELAAIKNEYGYTKEDNLILDDGLQVSFFDTLEILKNTIDDLSPKWEIKAVLQTINNRFALILI